MSQLYANITPNALLVELGASTRWEAIEALVEALVNAGNVAAEDRDIVVARAKRREHSQSTGIGFGLAIPHALDDRVLDFALGIGRSITGVEWSSLDDEPVHFAVLIVGPTFNPRQYQHLLALSYRVGSALLRLPDSMKFGGAIQDLARFVENMTLWPKH